jgi:predicted nucleic acid-binding protein
LRTVVDASVAAKWYSLEPGHEAADRLLAAQASGEGELFAPDLIVPEFANVLWKRVHRGEWPRAEAEEILRSWAIDCPELVPSSVLAASAFELALELELSVYDCLYLALALALEAPLATADRRLASAARRVSSPIELI